MCGRKVLTVRQNKRFMFDKMQPPAVSREHILTFDSSQSISFFTVRLRIIHDKCDGNFTGGV